MSREERSTPNPRPVAREKSGTPRTPEGGKEPLCVNCNHTEDDHDGYGGMCDGLGFNASREICGCQKFAAPAPSDTPEPPRKATKSGERCCNASPPKPAKPFLCTLLDGHSGDHEAWGGNNDKPKLTWPQAASSRPAETATEPTSETITVPLSEYSALFHERDVLRDKLIRAEIQIEAQRNALMESTPMEVGAGVESCPAPSPLSDAPKEITEAVERYRKVVAKLILRAAKSSTVRFPVEIDADDWKAIRERDEWQRQQTEQSENLWEEMESARPSLLALIRKEVERERERYEHERNRRRKLGKDLDAEIARLRSENERLKTSLRQTLLDAVDRIFNDLPLLSATTLTREEIPAVIRAIESRVGWIFGNVPLFEKNREEVKDYRVLEELLPRLRSGTTTPNNKEK